MVKNGVLARETRQMPAAQAFTSCFHQKSQFSLKFFQKSFDYMIY
jgi:hypothetical protein